MTAAVVYAAKSTEDKHGSIPTQLEDCRTLAEREGWPVEAEYQDEAASAYKGNRGDGLAKAKEHAERLRAVLIVQHTDRLARGDGVGADHLVEVLLWARKAGVRIVSTQDPTTCETGLAMAAMMGDRAHEDSRRKSLSVKAGMQRRAERGKWNGGPRPYGYRAVGPKGEKELVADPAESAIVARIFAEYVAGRPQMEIARGLNGDGLRAQRGGEWFQGTIGKLLANPLYAGRIRLNGEQYDGEHEAIVSAQVWDEAAQLRAASARTAGGGKGRHPKGSHLFVKGHLRCGECGGPMIPRTTAGRPGFGEGSVYESYRCFTRVREGVDACSQEPVKRGAIDGAVLDYFKRAVLDVDATREQIQRASERERVDIQTLYDQAAHEEAVAIDRLARVKTDYQDGRLDADDWTEQRHDLLAEQEAAQAKMEQLKNQERLAPDGDFDPEAATLRYLAELRSAVMGPVRDAGSVEALRAALLKVFDSFTLRRMTPAEKSGVYMERSKNPATPDVPTERDLLPERELVNVADEYELVQSVRPEAIARYGPRGITAEPQRIALGKAENIQVEGLPS